MVRTQIYLTESERTGLAALSTATGKPQSELIRNAVDSLIEQSGKERRDAAIARVAGMWKDRTDLPDFEELRRSWDRWDDQT